LSNDPTLRRTYQIEVEIDGLKGLRSHAAMQFGSAALAIQEAIKNGQSDRSLRALWESLHEFQRRYDCACRSVEAVEKHHMDSYIIQHVRDFMTGPEIERRMRARERQDEQPGEQDILRAILSELRFIRDKVDVSVPNGNDRVETRRELNSMQDGTHGQDDAQKP
jgi:hypothetical protein